MEIYDALRDNGTGYANVITELDRQIKITRSVSSKDSRRKFNEAVMGKTKNYHKFALRVEGQAKKVYCGKYKKPLKEKYVESVTMNFSDHLKQLNWNTRTICGRSLTWNEIKECAASQR